MNVFIFRYLVSTFLLVVLSLTASGQKLRFLIPDGAVLQHAGSIGYLSAGVNYDLFRNTRGSLDVLYGVHPASLGGGFSTLSAKFAYRPIAIRAAPWLIIHPVNPGIFISYTFDEDLSFVHDRDQYVKGYYYLSEAMRVHISFGSEFELNTARIFKSGKLKSAALYYEVNTNDMYLVNYFQNVKTMQITDVFKAGIGIRASF